MRVLDMRLTVLVTLILLGAAMPANCAEVPTVWFGLAGRAREGLATLAAEHHVRIDLHPVVLLPRGLVKAAVYGTRPARDI